MSKSNDNYEIDYKAMFENTKEILNEQYALYDEYCNLAREISESNDETTLVSKNVFKLSFVDQIKLLRITAKLATFSKQLCEKYYYFEESDGVQDGVQDDSSK